MKFSQFVRTDKELLRIIHKATLARKRRNRVLGVLFCSKHSDQHSFVVDVGRAGVPQEKDCLHGEVLKTKLKRPRIGEA
jgi:hypothetical protein